MVSNLAKFGEIIKTDKKNKLTIVFDNSLMFLYLQNIENKKINYFNLNNFLINSAEIIELEIANFLKNAIDSTINSFIDVIFLSEYYTISIKNTDIDSEKIYRHELNFLYKNQDKMFIYVEDWAQNNVILSLIDKNLGLRLYTLFPQSTIQSYIMRLLTNQTVKRHSDGYFVFFCQTSAFLMIKINGNIIYLQAFSLKDYINFTYQILALYKKLNFTFNKANLFYIGYYNQIDSMKEILSNFFSKISPLSIVTNLDFENHHSEEIDLLKLSPYFI